MKGHSSSAVYIPSFAEKSRYCLVQFHCFNVLIFSALLISDWYIYAQVFRSFKLY
jgi:hypothetical protein